MQAREWFRKHFDREAAGELAVCFAFELDGDAFALRIDRGRLELLEGSVEGADVTFRLSAADLSAVVAGSANADMLFLEERLAIEGDLSLAARLRRIFHPQ